MCVSMHVSSLLYTCTLHETLPPLHLSIDRDEDGVLFYMSTFYILISSALFGIMHGVCHVVRPYLL